MRLHRADMCMLSETRLAPWASNILSCQPDGLDEALYLRCCSSVSSALTQQRMAAETQPAAPVGDPRKRRRRSAAVEDAGEDEGRHDHNPDNLTPPCDDRADFEEPLLGDQAEVTGTMNLDEREDLIPHYAIARAQSSNVQHIPNMRSVSSLESAISRRHAAYGNIRPVAVHVTQQCSEGEGSWLF